MTGLLRIQVTDLLWNIHQRVNLFLVTFLLALLILTAPATDLNWDLLTGSIAHKLSRRLLNVLQHNGAGRSERTREAHLGGAVRLKDSPTLLGSLAVTDLPLRSVALLYRVPHCLLSTPGGSVRGKLDKVTNLKVI